MKLNTSIVQICFVYVEQTLTVHIDTKKTKERREENKTTYLEKRLRKGSKRVREAGGLGTSYDPSDLNFH